MKGQRQSVLGTLTLILQLGITMLVPIVSLTWLGAILGQHFGAAWIAIVLFVMGALGGAQACWRIIKGVIRSWPEDPVSQQSLRDHTRGGGSDERTEEDE